METATPAASAHCAACGVELAEDAAGWCPRCGAALVADGGGWDVGHPLAEDNAAHHRRIPRGTLPRPHMAGLGSTVQS